MRCSLPLSVVRALLTGVAGALAFAACSASSPTVVSVQKKVQGILGQPNVTAFLDVRFGDSLYRVQNRFPNGSLETAPYAADTYRINNIEVDGIRYQQVKYEFTTYSVIQLFMPSFTPISSVTLLENLVPA